MIQESLFSMPVKPVSTQSTTTSPSPKPAKSAKQPRPSFKRDDAPLSSFEVIEAQSIAIPSEYHNMYNRYIERVNGLVSVNTIMWVVLDYGHRIEMIDKKQHNARIVMLLKSGDNEKQNVAIEAMSRTLGDWRTR